MPRSTAFTNRCWSSSAVLDSMAAALPSSLCCLNHTPSFSAHISIGGAATPWPHVFNAFSLPSRTPIGSILQPAGPTLRPRVSGSWRPLVGDRQPVHPTIQGYSQRRPLQQHGLAIKQCGADLGAGRGAPDYLQAVAGIADRYFGAKAWPGAG